MFDEVEIKKILIKFSFPRLSGTNGEHLCFKELKDLIIGLGLEPNVQKFKFSTFYSRIYPKLASILIFFLVFFVYLNLENIVISFLIFIILILMGFLFIFTRAPEKIRFGKRLSSQNIYIKLRSENNEGYNQEKTSERLVNNSGRYNVLFFSHIDSKSQRLTISIRIITVKIWILSLICFVILIILRDLFFNNLGLGFLLLGLIPLLTILISTILTLINTTHNKSEGAIDNASGMACVVNLLKHFKRNPDIPNNFTIWFVFTGAEECGTMGIRYFYNEIKDFDRKKTIVVNFDAIGQSICAFHSPINSQSSLNQLFLKSIYSYNNNRKVIKTTKRRTIGAHSDGYFLKKKRYHGVGFGDLITYKYVHSKYDIIDNVNVKLLKELCELLTYSIKQIFQVYSN